MNINDVIVLKHDLPEHGLQKGMRGVIVAIFEEPEYAFEIEFCNERGETIIEVALQPEHVEEIII